MEEEGCRIRWSAKHFYLLDCASFWNFVRIETMKSISALGIAICCCVAAAGCARAPAQQIQLPPNKVTVSYPVEKAVADYVEFTGQTSAVKTVEVRARVWGYLESLHFTEGAIVNQGDLLFQIDQKPYKALVDQANGKIAQDNAQLKHNEATYRRYEKLKVQSAVTQEDLDRVLADRDAMKATLQADTADLEAKQLDLDYTTIRSPITGRVSRFEVTEGNVVQSGQNGGTLLTTIVSVDPMYVYFDVDERTLLAVRRLIRSGSLKNAQESAFPIAVGLADEDNFPHYGLVNFLDNRVDAGTGTLRVRGVFENHDGFLSPGLFVRCHLPLGEPRPRLLVAEEAIASDQEQKFVYVVNDANEVSYRPIQPGRLYDGMRVIEGGLAKNEKVVVKGLQRVRPGIKVEAELAPMPTRSAEADPAKPTQAIAKPRSNQQSRKVRPRTETRQPTEQ
jgi:RND family efflux transporter MFP subunit